MSIIQKTRTFIKSQWFKDHIFQSFLIVGVLLITFIGLFFVQSPSKVVKGANQAEITLTPSQQETPKAEEPSPLPPEILESNRDQTNSVVLGAILLVLIIVIGTLRAIRTANKKSRT